MAPDRKDMLYSSEKVTPFPAKQYNAAREREKNTVGKRLSEIRRKKGYTLSEFSDLLARYGVNAQRAAISKWENGETTPNIYQLTAICHALNIMEGPSYFTDMPSMRPPLNEIGMQKLEEYKNDLIASGRYQPSKAVEERLVEYVTKRVSRIPASAGNGSFLDEESFDYVEVPKNTVPDKADFGVYVSGDSMEPFYHGGQLVWVESCDRLNRGEVGVFIYDGDGFIKVYEEQVPDDAIVEYFTDSYGNIRPQVVLVSYNRAYPPKPVSPHGEFRIAGRVLK